MLVSVLVERYQRVFTRKLYINEDVNFHDYSDDENDVESRGSTGHIRSRANTKEIEDPDARAKNNAGFERDETTVTTVADVLTTPDIEDENENLKGRSNSRVHVIFGYVDDENHEPSRDVIETISSAIVQKQAAGDNIQLNVISNEQHRLSPYHVKFGITSSSEDSDSDENEALTEITGGSKGSVLKKFQCPPSPDNQIRFDKTEKQV
jgi:hypothetical protein